jgi:DNA ligase 1
MKPMLAREYEDDINPVGWWLSEKLDGVRAIWTGSEFISRNGKAFKVPADMIAAMPRGVVLDGELFAGRGNFQRAISLVKKGDWSGLEYVVFDLISADLFEARQSALSTVQLPVFCRILSQVKCKSADHLDALETEILSNGGEGVMLREAGSRYHHGRSLALLKLKRYNCTEAEVIGYESGAGRITGMIGALIVKMGETVFRVGSGLFDEDRQSPPKIGAQVTISYFGLTTAGIPRHPSFLAGRDYE